MKATFLLLAPIAIFSSCAPMQSTANNPVAPAANTGNPYAVPGVPTAPTAPATGGYVQEAAPYQPVQPINPPAVPTTPSVPTYTPPATTTDPTLNGNVYNIKKGDSLWGISRKYNTSVSAIKEANGMSDDTIIEGRTLIIPGR